MKYTTMTNIGLSLVSKISDDTLLTATVSLNRLHLDLAVIEDTIIAQLNGYWLLDATSLPREHFEILVTPLVINSEAFKVTSVIETDDSLGELTVSIITRLDISNSVITSVQVIRKDSLGNTLLNATITPDIININEIPFDANSALHASTLVAAFTL